jgi:hypothetical protein
MGSRARRLYPERGSVRGTMAAAGTPGTVPKWRNGRRCGLKHRWPQGRVGSTPTFGTMLSAPGSDADVRESPHPATRTEAQAISAADSKSSDRGWPSRWLNICRQMFMHSTSDWKALVSSQKLEIVS